MFILMRWLHVIMRWLKASAWHASCSARAGRLLCDLDSHMLAAYMPHQGDTCVLSCDVHTTQGQANKETSGRHTSFIRSLRGPRVTEVKALTLTCTRKGRRLQQVVKAASNGSCIVS